MTILLSNSLRKVISTSSKFIKKFTTGSTMSDLKPQYIPGIPLNDIVNKLNKFADTSLAESWDNVGLLIEPTTPKLITHAMLTNDLTEAVLEEAASSGVDLIISYHPPIFAPLKSITTKTWKERIAAKCLENRIAVYSPHTSFDAVKGGMGDWLISAFPHTGSTPIIPGQCGDYGMGRIGTLKQKISIEEAVNLVKKHTNLAHVKLARACKTDGTISTVAVCPGSGSSVLKNVKADLYLTGEMLHHDVLDAVHKGINVILTNHSNSERGFLREFATTLGGLLNNDIKISVSKTDSDPLEIV